MPMRETHEVGSEAAPERWLVVEVPRPTVDDQSAEVVEALSTLGLGGVEEEADHLRVYVPGPDAERALERIGSALRGVLPTREIEIRSRWQPHQDWSEIWRAGQSARRITERLIVAPSWDPGDPDPGDLVITLDPGMAFGTAEHATTRGCLRLLDGTVRPGERLADIGAGSGILSIAAVLLGAAHVTAVELDARSCAVARENCEANAVADQIEVRNERVEPEFLPGSPAFDGIVSNIESGVLIPLLPGFHAGLAAEGWLILSGVLESEADEVRRRSEEAGFRLEARDLEDGWWSAVLRRQD